MSTKVNMIKSNAAQSSKTEPIVALKHPARWVGVIVVAIGLAMLANTLITNPRFNWPVVAGYFGAEPILDGLKITIVLTVIAMPIGIILGTVLALSRSSENRIVSSAALGFIWFFRGTPLLVQLIFWYNISALYPQLSVGVPFGPTFFSGNANDLITPFFAALLGLSLNEGAYMAEIVRAGISSVEVQQSEAARALGMTEGRITRRIVLPQALRVIVPPTGNQVISMLKATSLVSVLALGDLLYSAQAIYSRTFETVPLLIVASLWYLIVVTLLSSGQYFIEQRLNNKPQTFLRKFTQINRSQPALPGAEAEGENRR